MAAAALRVLALISAANFRCSRVSAGAMAKEATKRINAIVAAYLHSDGLAKIRKSPTSEVPVGSRLSPKMDDGIQGLIGRVIVMLPNALSGTTTNEWPASPVARRSPVSYSAMNSRK